MEFLVYRSRALVAPGSSEARKIVAESLRNNRRDGLTGFLHHEVDLFVQYIEGPTDSLWRLWQVLLGDPRHLDLTLIGRGLVSHRYFDGCRMGYSNAAACFVDFLEEAAGKSLLDEASPREAVWFLRGASQRVDLGLVH